MSRARKALETFLAEKNWKKAKKLIEDRIIETESMVHAVLNHNTPQDVIDLALEVFLNSRQNHNGLHSHWVHSLSHFTEELWQKE